MYAHNAPTNERSGGTSAASPPPMVVARDLPPGPLAASESARFANEECPSCYTELSGTQELTVLECGHVLHTACLFEWTHAVTGRHNRCPECRQVFDRKHQDRAAIDLNIKLRQFAADGDLDGVQRSVARGATTQKSAMWRAAASGYLDVVEFLVEQVGKDALVQHIGETGESTMDNVYTDASRNGHTHVVTFVEEMCAAWGAAPPKWLAPSAPHV